MRLRIDTSCNWVSGRVVNVSSVARQGEVRSTARYVRSSVCSLVEGLRGSSHLAHEAEEEKLRALRAHAASSVDCEDAESTIVHSRRVREQRDACSQPAVASSHDLDDVACAGRGAPMAAVREEARVETRVKAKGEAVGSAKGSRASLTDHQRRSSRPQCSC